MTTSTANPLSWKAPATPGTYTLTLRAVASDGTKSSAVTKSVVVSAASGTTFSSIPTLTGVDTTTGGTTETYSASGGVTDPAGAVTYEWTLPDGSISTANPLSWTPPSTAGTYALTLRGVAADGTKSDPVTKTVTVTAATTTFTSQPIITGDSAAVGGVDESYIASGGVTDPAGAVTYEWTLPDGSISTTNPLSWTPPSTAGTYALTLRGVAADGTKSDSVTKTVTVSAADPTLTPGASVMGGVVDADGLGILWATPGTYSFIPPPGAIGIHAIAVGGGGAPVNAGTSSQIGGGGGALGWANDIAVDPDGVAVVVGAGGVSGATYVGGASSVGTVVVAGGGSSSGVGLGGVFSAGNGGGDGGKSVDTNRGGAGAGGYTGRGGNGGSAAATTAFTAAVAGSGGGGGGAYTAGGGVGVYGVGTTGSKGVPGSGGVGKSYGGGGCSNAAASNNGGGGVVRIMWGKTGVTRSFPSSAALVP